MKFLKVMKKGIIMCTVLSSSSDCGEGYSFLRLVWRFSQ